MPRAQNFYYQNPTGEIGNALVRAILGDPAAAAEQQQQRARLALTDAQREEALAHGGLYTSQTGAVDRQNAASDKLPGLAQAMFPVQRPMPSLDDADFVSAAGTEPPRQNPDEAFRAGLPMFVATLGQMQGDKVDTSETVGTMASFASGDEMARRGLVAQGHTPGKDFAITPERADQLAANGYKADQDQAFGVARINNESDIPVAQIRAGATVQAAGLRADGTVRAAGVRSAGPAPGFDVIQRSFPGISMNSGARSVEHNRQVGGSPGSYHTGAAPGVMAYDFNAIPGMSIEQVAAKVEADSGGTIQVVEMRDERGRVGPNGKKLGGYHLALRFTTPQTRWGAGGGPKPLAAPKAVPAAQIGVIDKTITDYFAAANIKLPPASQNAVRSLAIKRFRETGDPVGSAMWAINYLGEQSRQKRARAQQPHARPAAPAPAPAPRPTAARPATPQPAAARPAQPRPAPARPAQPRPAGNKPPVQGAKQAPDGNWYVRIGTQPNGQPKWGRVEGQ